MRLAGWSFRVLKVMVLMNSIQPCPCGSSLGLNVCCGQYVYEGKKPLTAEQLMRSRFTAFCHKQSDYLLASWHPKTRPDCLAWDDGSPQWERLDILSTQDGGEFAQTGVVEFRAFYCDSRGQGVLHERSRFERWEGNWVYTDGTLFPV